MRSVRNARDRAELLQRLRMISPESRPRWGRMSAHQMVCHLGDICRVSLGERRTTPVGNPLAHTVIKYFLLGGLPIPKGVPTTPELDQERQGTAPADFDADVRTLEELLERIGTAGSLPDAHEHPFFGPLSTSQWGRFHYRHMDHHLRQFGV